MQKWWKQAKNKYSSSVPPLVACACTVYLYLRLYVLWRWTIVTAKVAVVQGAEKQIQWHLTATTPLLWTSKAHVAEGGASDWSTPAFNYSSHPQRRAALISGLYIKRTVRRQLMDSTHHLTLISPQIPEQRIISTTPNPKSSALWLNSAPPWPLHIDPKCNPTPSHPTRLVFIFCFVGLLDIQILHYHHVYVSVSGSERRVVLQYGHHLYLCMFISMCMLVLVSHKISS